MSLSVLVSTMRCRFLAPGTGFGSGLPTVWPHGHHLGVGVHGIVDGDAVGGDGEIGVFEGVDGGEGFFLGVVEFDDGVGGEFGVSAEGGGDFDLGGAAFGFAAASEQ